MSIVTSRRHPVKPSRVSKPRPVPFGSGINPKPFRLTDDDYRPSIEAFSPSLEDRSWAEAMFRPVAEGPGFVGALQIAARRFRTAPGEFNSFVAGELDRLAALAVAIGASNPTDFERLRDLAEMDARETWEARGYDLGFEAARGEHYGLPVG